MALSPTAHLEALLYAEGGPLTRDQACTILGCDAGQLSTLVADLHSALVDRGLSLIETEKELELRTAPETADTIRVLRESELTRDLGKASLETLAIILYRGTATRAEIDWVRGVNSGAALRSLSLRGLIERAEDKDDKRRARYVATVEALAHLGVSTKEALPRYAELSTLAAAAEATREETEL